MTRSVFRLLFIAVLCLAATGARAAQLVVVSGGAPGLGPGTVIAADAPVNVPAGASVTLVTETGRTVTLTGPHAGPALTKGEAGKGDASLISSLSGLLKGEGRESAALGAMRSAAPTKPPEDPWVVDVGHSGVHCVPAGAQVTLWRAREGRSRVLKLKNLDDKSRANVEWAAGADTLSWPSDVALRDGTRYLASFKGSRGAKKLTLRLVPKALANDAQRAAWMAANGCEHQARRLLARLR